MTATLEAATREVIEQCLFDRWLAEQRSVCRELQPVRGLDPFFVSGTTILVREVHGSAEVPQLSWSMACNFSSRRRTHHRRHGGPVAE